VYFVARLEFITAPVQNEHMPSTDRMTEFLQVVQSGSISGAARILGLERATLSRRVSALEAELGVRLMHRRTTKLVLTAAGQELSRRARRVVADAEEVWASVQRLDDEPRGLLRVSVTGPHFGNLFTEFLRDFPNVELELRSTTHHVDMVADGIDVAIRIGEINDANLIARKISSDRLVVVASPGLNSEQGVLRAAADLKKKMCITGFADGWTPARTWPLLNGKSIDVHGRLTANEIALARAAALDGLGYALLPSAYVRSDLQAGRLVTVLADVVGKEIPVHLVYVDREYIEPKVRVFIDRAVKATAREMPPRAEGL
jgi:DNA-binding transcriptional LysR family regulator